MAEIKDPENTIIMTLKDGVVVIELLADVAQIKSQSGTSAPEHG